MVRKHFIIVILLLCYFKGFSQTREQDHSSSNHLYLKADVLSPVLSLLPSIKTYTFGASIEYKIKSRWGLQLNGYYYWGDNYHPNDTKGFMITPEGRYYFNEHFVGAYFKFDNYEYYYSHNSFSPEGMNKNIGIGALYGYQKVIKRFVIEGRIGIGVNTNVENNYFYRRYPEDLPILWDVLLAVNVGWKIF